MKTGIVFFIVLATAITAHGQVSMCDAYATMKIAVGLSLPNSIQQVTADVNRDGEITAYDAALIARYVNGILDEASHIGEVVIVNGREVIIGEVCRYNRKPKEIESKNK